MQPSSPYFPWSPRQTTSTRPFRDSYGIGLASSARSSSMSLVLLRMRSLTGISQRAAWLSMKMGRGSYLRRSILLKMFLPLSSETSFSEESPPMMIPTFHFCQLFFSAFLPS